MVCRDITRALTGQIYVSFLNMSNAINWTYSTHGRIINMHTILTGINEDQLPFGRPKHRWEDTKMLLREMRHVNVH